MSEVNRFAVTRHDGRSDGQVVLDLVDGAEPGRVFTFAEIAAALMEGTGREYGVPEVRGAVGRAHVRMLKEQARVLHSVRCVGYRVAEAREHHRLARHRRHRAGVQLRRGLQVLQNVRWEEMDRESRVAHEGQLLVSLAVAGAVQQLERRVDSHDALLKRIVGGKE